MSRVGKLVRVAITSAVELPLLTLKLLFVIAVSEPFLEKGSDGVCDTLKFFVALELGGLQATIDVSSDKGHRDGVGSGAMGGDIAGVDLRRDCWEDGFWREYERAWRLSARQGGI